MVKWLLCVCEFANMSYQTTKKRERTVAMITTANKTSRITNPKLPSSCRTGSGKEQFEFSEKTRLNEKTAGVAESMGRRDVN